MAATSTEQSVADLNDLGHPAFHAFSGPAWILGAVVYVAISRLFYEGIAVVGYFAIPMTLFGLIRIHQTCRHWSLNARLTSSLPPWIKEESIYEKQAQSGQTYIGKGFNWDPVHSRMLRRISNLDSQETLKAPPFFVNLLKKAGIVSDGPQLEGQHAIHGCARTEDDLFVSRTSQRSHTLVLGTNGAGKTRMLETLVAQSIARGCLTNPNQPKIDRLDRLIAEEEKKRNGDINQVIRKLRSLPDSDETQQERKRLCNLRDDLEDNGTKTLQKLKAKRRKLESPKKSAVFILDPKGDPDLRDRAFATAKRFGREDDFRYFSPTHNDFSFRVNPLGTYNRRSELANRIAALMPSGGDSESFKQFAWRAIEVVVEGMDYAEITPQLTNVKDFVDAGIPYLLGKCLDKHLRSVGRYYSIPIGQSSANQKRIPYDQVIEAQAKRISGDHDDATKRVMAQVAFYKTYVKYAVDDFPIAHKNLTVDSLIDVWVHDRQHYSKLISNLIPILVQLTTEPMDVLLSEDTRTGDPRIPTRFQWLVDQGRIVYINLESLSDAIVGSSIGSLFIADLTACAARRHHDGVNEPSVSIFIDEAAEMMNDPLIQLLNKGRSAGFEVTLASQTTSDFVARMGSEPKARQVLGNINTTIAMRLQDADSINTVIEKFGETSFDQSTSSKSTTTIAPMAQRGRDFSGSVTKNVQSSDVALVSPDTLSNLPPGHFFGHFPGGRKVKGRVMLFPLSDEDRFVPSHHGASSTSYKPKSASFANPRLSVKEKLYANLSEVTDSSKSGRHPSTLSVIHETDSDPSFEKPPISQQPSASPA